MCGFVGFVEFGQAHAQQEDLLAMRDRLRHRGPDDQGHWFKPGAGLAHARLSILDLSSKAHQPMRRGNLVLVYNGEIYNYRQLREELQRMGHQFTSDSDTEVLLCGFIQWGSGVLARLDGMFAFAIYDEGVRTLFLARDKAGIKPLVYYADAGRFVFASELKALWHYPGLVKELSAQGLEDYLRLGYTTGRVTMFKGVARVLPGEYLSIDVKGGIRRDVYWPGVFTPEKGLNFADAAARLKLLLAQEFKMSLVSDVPVGVCISGGVDSNVLAGILAKEHGLKVRTYSLGGADAAFDENAQAAAVAKHLGTDHRALVMDPFGTRALLLDTIAHYDEPMADQNMLSLRVMARQARADGVKVLLSGLGGDELFYGYPTVDVMARLKALFFVPAHIRRLLPKQGLAFSNAAYKAVHIGQQKDFYSAVYGMTGNCFFDDEVERLMVHKSLPAREDHLKETFDRQQATGTGIIEALMRVDLKSYLPDNGLALSDMSAMAEGVEMRVPYLNGPVMDFALRVPSAVKKHGGEFKALLRSMEREYLPSHLTMQGKKGFYPFVKTQWLKGELKDLTDELLGQDHIRRQGIFDPQAVISTRHLFEHSNVNVSGKIWDLLMFELWAETHL